MERPAERPGQVTTATPTHAEDLTPFVRRELGKTTYFLAHFRLGGAAASTLIGVLFLFEPADHWRSWALFVAACVLAAVGVRDRRVFRGASFSFALFGYIVGTVLAMQTVFIVATGGIDSPLMVIYVPTTMVGALALGDVRRFLLFALLPAGAIWLLALGRTTGLLPDLLPAALGADGRSTTYNLFFAAVLTFAALIGGTVGLKLRQALDRAARAAALARREAVETMRERNRELMALSGAVAHELKNPLASIQGLAGLLARKMPEGSREEERMAVLLSETRRTAAILEEFLNFSRPVHGLALADVPARTVVDDVVTVHCGLADERGVALRATGSDAISLRADPRKLKQVLVNLVQNAIDASPRGGAVTVDVGRCPLGARFTVSDEGPGLPAELQGRLFSPGATTKGGGSGLGLVVARSIAEQHGGTLALQERPAGGVAAELDLPLTPHVPTEEATEQAPEEQTS